MIITKPTQELKILGFYAPFLLYFEFSTTIKSSVKRSVLMVTKRTFSERLNLVKHCINSMI